MGYAIRDQVTRCLLYVKPISSYVSCIKNLLKTIAIHLLLLVIKKLMLASLVWEISRRYTFVQPNLISLSEFSDFINAFLFNAFQCRIIKLVVFL